MKLALTWKIERIINSLLLIDDPDSPAPRSPRQIDLDRRRLFYHIP
jgi:hypothetical protein